VEGPTFVPLQETLERLDKFIAQQNAKMHKEAKCGIVASPKSGAKSFKRGFGPA